MVCVGGCYATVMPYYNHYSLQIVFLGRGAHAMAGVCGGAEGQCQDGGLS